MLPVADLAGARRNEAAQRVPYVLAVDADDAAPFGRVDLRLMQAARRCLLLWQRLRAQWRHDHMPNDCWRRRGGVDRGAGVFGASSARRERSPRLSACARNRHRSRPSAPRRPRTHRTKRPDRDVSLSELQRCQLIDRMFAYDERKQAHLKDVTAGTYRQLVEAAERGGDRCSSR